MLFYSTNAPNIVENIIADVEKIINVINVLIHANLGTKKDDQMIANIQPIIIENKLGTEKFKLTSSSSSMSKKHPTIPLMSNLSEITS